MKEPHHTTVTSDLILKQNKEKNKQIYRCSKMFYFLVALISLFMRSM